MNQVFSAPFWWFLTVPSLFQQTLYLKRQHRCKAEDVGEKMGLTAISQCQHYHWYTDSVLNIFKLYICFSSSWCALHAALAAAWSTPPVQWQETLGINVLKRAIHLQKGYTCISVLKCEILCENKKALLLHRKRGGRCLSANCEQKCFLFWPTVEKMTKVHPHVFFFSFACSYIYNDFWIYTVSFNCLSSLPVNYFRGCSVIHFRVDIIFLIVHSELEVQAVRLLGAGSETSAGGQPWHFKFCSVGH